jgi:type IV pilus assembly protein PilV
MTVMIVHRFTRHEAGASLIEMLVATLLLAVGMLAMAALQASSLQLSKDAEFRAVASELAQGFGEMVKANSGGAAAYNAPLAQFVLPAPPVVLQTACDAPGVACTNQQIALQDISRLQALARSRLPNGQVSMVFTPAVGQVPSFIDLWVGWLPPDTRTGVAAVDNQFNNGCQAGFDAGSLGVRCQYFRISP